MTLPLKTERKTEDCPEKEGSPFFDVGEIRRQIVGLERQVPIIAGRSRTYVNLDNAATTPPFQQVLDAVAEFCPWYSSVHRGSGYKSALSTDLYEQCHRDVARFVDADPLYHTVILCGNATQAINMASRSLGLEPGDLVLTTVIEHHSNLLPWRLAGPTEYIGLRGPHGALDLEELERKLKQNRGRVKLVAVTGASNVTGYTPPLRRIARLAHEHGAEFLVDAAQLAAHQPVTMGSAGDPERIDFLCFSAHKMYAPFGSGALIGPRHFFEGKTPSLVGGGGAKFVSPHEVEWADLPDREEAGTPNVLGALALVKAMEILEAIGLTAVARHEQALTERLLQRLASVPRVRVFGDPDPATAAERNAVVPILVDDIPHARLAAILSHEHGIGVRHGCFCAHQYVAQLLGLEQSAIEGHIRRLRNNDMGRLPGFVRISLGLYNTAQEIDCFCDALEDIVSNGPRGRYNLDRPTGRYLPEGVPASEFHPMPVRLF